jgi:hypothetical protein
MVMSCGVAECFLGERLVDVARFEGERFAAGERRLTSKVVLRSSGTGERALWTLPASTDSTLDSLIGDKVGSKPFV